MSSMKVKYKRTDSNIDNLLNNMEEGEIGIVEDKKYLVFKNADGEPYIRKCQPLYTYFKVITEDDVQYGIPLNGEWILDELTLCDSNVLYRHFVEDITSGESFFCWSPAISYDLSRFYTTHLTDMSRMFFYNPYLPTLDLSNFDTTHVTNMSYMFEECSSLTTLNISNFDTSNVTDMNSMFSCCSSLISLDVSGFETFWVTNMENMFKCCSGITSLDLSSFDTSNVINMAYMFYGCTSLVNLNLRGFNTSNATNISGFFGRCPNLRYINLGSNFFDTNQTIDFSDAENLGLNEDDTLNDWKDVLNNAINSTRQRYIKLPTKFQNTVPSSFIATLQSKGCTFV